jgi:hypothetical protein
MSDPHAAPRTWWQDEPRRLAAERAAMARAAPDLVWSEAASGWIGPVPLWPFDRSQPAGLVALVDGRPFRIHLVCGPAFPMVEPAAFPQGIEIPVEALGWTEWHLLPNGALCLSSSHSGWDPAARAADLVPKISGWYIEYNLKIRGLVHEMTGYGLAADPSLDPLLSAFPEIPS